MFWCRWISLWLGFSVCQEGLCNWLLIRAHVRGLHSWVSWRTQRLSCTSARSETKRCFFLLLLWTCSLSAGLEVGVTGTESSSSSTDSGWGSDQDMWTSATQLEVIRSDLRCSAPYGAVVVMDVWHPAFILPLLGVDRFEATGHDPAASCPWPVKSVLSLITTNIAFYHMIWQRWEKKRYTPLLKIHWCVLGQNII